MRNRSILHLPNDICNPIKNFGQQDFMSNPNKNIDRKCQDDTVPKNLEVVKTIKNKIKCQKYI